MLQISKSLREKLSKIRAKQLADLSHDDDVFHNQDVIIVTLGLGPAMYLHLDGHVIVWDPGSLWLQNYETPQKTEDLKLISGAMVIGAKKFALPELLDLLPPPTPDATVCSQCNGERTTSLGGKSDHWIVCPTCNGFGWQSQ
jgi:hypothetical protein